MVRFCTLLVCSLFATSTAFADVTPEGTWKGEYVCKKTVRSIVIKLGAFDGKAADGELEFFTPPGADKPVRGSFKVRASHDAERGRLRLKAGDWISRPDRYKTLNFQGSVNPDDGTLTGKLGRRCKLQDVVRTTPPVERLVVAAPKVDKPETTEQAAKKSPLSALAPSPPAKIKAKSRDLGSVVTGMGDLEGVWIGKILDAKRRGSFATLRVTESGADLSMTSDGVSRCRLVLDPQITAGGSLSAFVYRGNASSCTPKKLVLSQKGDLLLLSFQSKRRTTVFELGRHAGKGTQASAAPQIAIRGVKIGMQPDDALAAMPEPSQTQKGAHTQLYPHVARNIAATRNGHVKFDGYVVSGYWATDSQGIFKGMGEDVVSAYAPKDGPVVAIQRRYAPVGSGRPTVKNTVKSLIETYGKPSLSKAKKRSTSLTWAFSPDGSLLPPGDTRCSGVGSEAVLINTKMMGEPISHKLTSRLGCGATLMASLLASTQGDELFRMDIHAFNHRALANLLWAQEREKANASIKARLESKKKTQKATPKL